MKMKMRIQNEQESTDVVSVMKCRKCGAKLIAKPVPGAKQFPRRLECPEHGWQQEKLRPIRMRFHKDRPNW
jgi:DNA-directed RNA polymerase subunit RPC12/RpoP